MKKSRFTEAQIMGVLRLAAGGVLVPELCRARHQQCHFLQMAGKIWGHGCLLVSTQN